MSIRRKDAVHTWSPLKGWIMGIVSALFITLITAVGSILYNKWYAPPLSERERIAVYALINDIRQHPFFIHGVYQGSHDFITSQWRKCDETKSFYESAEMPVTVISLGYAMGLFGDGGRLLDEKCGVISGFIKDLDNYNEAADGTIAQVTIEPEQDYKMARIELDSHKLVVYTLQPNAFPLAVLAHVSKLDLPSSIREQLSAMQMLGAPMSFESALKTSKDFVMSSDESMTERDKDLTMPVYFHDNKFSLFEYASLCLRLARSIQEWADRYSIDLGDDALRVYESHYKNENDDA